MSYTIRNLIFDVVNLIIRNPKALWPITTPATRAHIRSAYNQQNNVTTFDADFLSLTRAKDTDNVYANLSDGALQSLIDEAVPYDEDISTYVALPVEPA